MDSLLTPGWLGELGAVPLAAGEAATASIHARSVGVLDEAGTGRLCAATTTLLRAIGNEEPDGGLAIRATTAGDVPGLEVVVASAAWRWLDAPEDVEALRAGVDALDLDRRHGEGACARIRVYAEPPGSQAEVGVAGRPHPAETVSGDEAFVVERDGWLIVAVIDGLGHGPGAHAESVFAVEQLQRSAAIDPTELLADCQGAFRGRRGVVMSIVSIEPGRTALLHAGLGNVTTRLCRRDDSRGLAARPSFVGAPRVRMPRSEKAEIGHDELVVMFTDGLRRGATLAGDPRAWRSHPGLTARRLGAERTGNDDHLAAVIRCR